MNTTTDRTSKAYHRRHIDSATNSAAMADQALYALLATQAQNTTLRKNSYWTDMVEKAKMLADEMAADVDCCIEAAIEDGFDFEDFGE